jgi:prophage regulatory protein
VSRRRSEVQGELLRLTLKDTMPTCHINQIKEALRVLRKRQVCDRTGVSPATIYRGIKAGTFPAGFMLSPRMRGWTETEIEAWIQSRIMASRNEVTA